MNPIVAKCLADAQLLAIANGESPGEGMVSHLETCPACARKLADYRSQITAIRSESLVEDDKAPDDGAGGAAMTPAAPAGPKTVAVEMIGPYQIIEELGAGGQARVYRAMHPTLACYVVLKMGHEPVAARDQADDRIVREARLLKQLHHPHIAQVHDLFFENDRPVLVLDYVSGRSLRQISRERRLAPREAGMIIARIARALAPAHAQGVFHRDITPGNIMVDEKGQPRLIDFGLARYRHAWGETKEIEGYTAGTIGFMPPEQYEGLHDEIDARTDVYALGAVLRDVLTVRPRGQAITPPQAGPIGMTASPGQSATLDSAYAAALRKAGVPRRLCRIIHKATRPKKEDRYATAAELARDLERFVNEPRNALIACALGVLIIASVMTATAIWKPVPAPPPPMPPSLQDLLVRTDGMDLGHDLPLGQKPPVYLKVDVPRGWKPLLVWIDPEGGVETHDDLVRTGGEGGPYDHYEYWRSRGFEIGHLEKGPGGASKFEPDAPGWKLIMIVALPGDAPPERQAQLVADLKAAAPAHEFPGIAARDAASHAFYFGVSELRHTAPDRSFRSLPLSPAEEAVQTRLTHLQETLRQKGYQFFTGVAAPYMP